jgi:hypothetical protein
MRAKTETLGQIDNQVFQRPPRLSSLTGPLSEGASATLTILSHAAGDVAGVANLSHRRFFMEV